MGPSSKYSYLLSLPERVVRSVAAVSGGLLREIGEVALPARLRRTTLYRTMVDVALRFLIEEVGKSRAFIRPRESWRRRSCCNAARATE